MPTTSSVYSPDPPPGNVPNLRSDIGLIVSAWLLSVGIDFLLHGGILARLYFRESPFLLPAESAFARIPVGYFTFLVLTVSLWWLLGVLGTVGGFRGFRTGLLAGAVTWGALVLGLYSITTAPVDLLVAWWLGQSIELGAAGAVIGAGRKVAGRKRIHVTVAVVIIGCLVVTIVLQTLGWAPAMETRSG
jgi:hypothetical protein